MIILWWPVEVLQGQNQDAFLPHSTQYNTQYSLQVKMACGVWKKKMDFFYNQPKRKTTNRDSKQLPNADLSQNVLHLHLPLRKISQDQNLQQISASHYSLETPANRQHYGGIDFIWPKAEMETQMMVRSLPAGLLTKMFTSSRDFFPQ